MFGFAHLILGSKEGVDLVHDLDGIRERVLLLRVVLLQLVLFRIVTLM